MKIGVIADDLTGANATGVKLAKQGLIAATLLQQSIIPEKEMAVIIDTDSRYVGNLIAKQRVFQAAQKLQHWGASLFCKRIDSTIRGNIGEELDAMLEVLGENTVAIIAPSYPESGRTVVGGYLLVNGVLVQETDVARDPIHPLTQSFIPSILEEQSEHRVVLMDLHSISQGSAKIEEEIRFHIARGIRLIVCDSITEEHVESVARAMANITDRVLVPVDPGPLTSHFVRICGSKEREEQRTILVTVGSVTSVTRSQLNYFDQQLKLKPIIVHPEKLASFSETWQQEINNAVQEASNLLNKESIIVITTNHPTHERLDLKKLAKGEGVTENELAKRITAGLAEISKQLITKAGGSIEGCFFSGGDVTASFCEAVKANGVMLLDEVMPLVAYGQVMGGPYDGLSVVTKGGLVGNEQTIYESIRFIKQKLRMKKECFG